MEEIFQVLQQLKQLLSVAGQQVLFNLPKLESESENSNIEDANVVEDGISLYQVSPPARYARKVSTHHLAVTGRWYSSKRATTKSRTHYRDCAIDSC